MISYSEESLLRCRPDIESLIPAQWEETGDAFIECKPDWAMYEAMEQVGALILMMVRDEGRPIGYLTGSVYRHPNSTGHRVASIPTYFVEHRPGRSLILRSMLSHGINLAMKKGAWKVNVKTEYNHSAGRILEAMGLAPSAVEYVMTREARYA